MHNLTIIGRRWFQRGPGNTYHTAEMIIDGVSIGRTSRSYGYGEQYIQSALDYLATHKLIPERERHSNGGYRELHREWFASHGITLFTTAIDVSREKDL